MLSNSPGRRNTSAKRLSVGRKRIANSVVRGGAMYLTLIVFANERIRFSRALLASATILPIL
jgi:hypothetical protein